ncbi:MAG: hypothetical protein K1X29_10050 [Bdellovibrionales bacterium]|nr:hypothetical protein [Bdellovibrionales bacterium]
MRNAFHFLFVFLILTMPKDRVLCDEGYLDPFEVEGGLAAKIITEVNTFFLQLEQILMVQSLDPSKVSPLFEQVTKDIILIKAQFLAVSGPNRDLTVLDRIAEFQRGLQRTEKLDKPMADTLIEFRTKVRNFVLNKLNEKHGNFQGLVDGWIDLIRQEVTKLSVHESNLGGSATLESLIVRQAVRELISSFLFHTKIFLLYAVYGDDSLPVCSVVLGND